MSKVETNFNKAISENWSIVAGFLAFIFTAGTLPYLLSLPNYSQSLKLFMKD